MSDGSKNAATLSAQGTRLNRRGLDSRRRFIDAAISILADGDPTAASANQVAKRAGFTWGAVQHLFGDTDGVWAAVMEELIERVARFSSLPPVRSGTSLRRRMTDIIELLWLGFGSPEARAAEHLRMSLPRDPKVLSATYPKTDAVLRRFDREWAALWDQLFAGLPVTKPKLRRIRSLVPAALRGLRREAEMTSFVEADDGRRALVDALVAYVEH